MANFGAVYQRKMREKNPLRAAVYQARYRERYPGREKESGYRARLKKRVWLRFFKDTPCAECERLFPYYVMDFDHRDPDTKRRAASACYSDGWDDLLAEVAKCDVVCANCHRERTFKSSSASSSGSQSAGSVSPPPQHLGSSGSSSSGPQTNMVASEEDILASWRK